jgi:tetratricopeptide (TPR) repeat protein
VADLKNTGNKLFAEKDYGEAMKQYDAALSQLPDGASDRADLLCNKAACFYALNRCDCCMMCWVVADLGMPLVSYVIDCAS